jgi:hypothetical protein
MQKSDDVVYDCEFFFKKKLSDRSSKKQWVPKNSFVDRTSFAEIDRRSSSQKRKRKRNRKKNVSRTDRKIEPTIVNACFEKYDPSNPKDVFFRTRVHKELIRDKVLNRLTGLEVLSLSLVNSVLRSFVVEYFYDVVVPDLFDLFRRENNILRTKMRNINLEWTMPDFYRHPDYIDTKNVTINGKLGDNFVSYKLASDKK